ncbi:MAG: hypothetical protein B6D61_04675 [Bacteroidetes bacterium 4484_249]|nr:MAG: hypothetical protein B6D61_04675 [Bacteroidetes bacterium 4484_249]
MRTIEFQKDIARKIFLIKDSNLLSQLNDYIYRLIKNQKNESSGVKEDISNYKTFEQWNEYLQTVEEVDLDEFLPEWGMTNFELRKFIFDAEKSDTISEDKFYKEIKTW